MLELVEKAAGDGPVADTVVLPFALRQKSRQRVRLASGREAAIVLPPGEHLHDGDRLQAADGTAVRVVAATESVSTARTDDPLRFARACYHLGNRHVALQIGSGFVRYLPDHVLDDMVRGLGLTVTRESVAFEPEGGAYAGHSHGGSHSHSGHGHDHDHGHRH
jgi:urease accessory protein